MKPGDLVKLTRASIGIPNGTLGLILSTVEATPNTHTILYHNVKLYGLKKPKSPKIVRRLPRDLEVINALS